MPTSEAPSGRIDDPPQPGGLWNTVRRRETDGERSCGRQDGSRASPRGLGGVVGRRQTPGELRVEASVSRRRRSTSLE